METIVATSEAELVGLSGLEQFYSTLGAQVIFGLAIIGALTILVIFLGGFWNLILRGMIPKRTRQIK